MYQNTAQNRQHSSPSLQEAQRYWSFQLPLGQTLYGGLLLAWAHLSTSTVPFDIPGPSRGSRQTHNLMRFNSLTSHLAWHLIGSRNCVPSSWRQGVTSPSQVHSPMTICPQPQAQGRRRGLGKNPNQERYNLNQSNSPVSLEIMLCCSQVCWCLLETGMLTLHPKQNDNGFSWFKTSSYVYWNGFFIKELPSDTIYSHTGPYSPSCPEVLISHHGRLRLPLIKLLCVLASKVKKKNPILESTAYSVSGNSKVKILHFNLSTILEGTPWEWTWIMSVVKELLKIILLYVRALFSSRLSLEALCPCHLAVSRI